MAIRFKGDMTKVVAKNKGDMTKVSLRKRVASIITQLVTGGGGAIADYYTKMLLHFDDEASPASFSDAAPAPLTQTKFGTVATSTTQSKFGGRSLSLNGVNTNKLQFANPKSGLQSTFNFGAQDFTIEGWFYITALTNQYQSLVEFYDPSLGGSAGPVLLINPSNRIAFHEDTNGYALATSITPMLNQWYHIAVVRKTNVLTIYVNGTPEASSAFSATLRTSYAQCNIGNFPHIGGGYTSLNGYVDNVRVQLGEAVYSPTGFTPETSPFTDGKNCLLHFDGTDGSVTVTDSSTYGKVATVTGGAVISTAKSKFGGSSLYLPGNNTNAVVMANSSDFAFGTGDFTVEAWINVAGMSAGLSETYYNAIFDTGAGNNSGRLFFCLNSSRKLIAFNGGGVFFTGSTSLSLDTWYHVAVVRKSNSFLVYLNGSLEGSTAVSFNLTENAMRLGSNFDAASVGGIGFNGYMDEFRVTKGTALYNQDITPPTSAVSANSYTKFLMNFDGTNDSTNFVESSSNLTVNVQGNVTISTEQSKFGGSSLKMTGGNGSNGLKIDNRTTSTQPIYLGDSDWTIEGWFWFNQKNVGYQPLFSFSNNDGNHPGPQIYIRNENTLDYSHQNSNYIIQSGFNPDANRWYHIAVSKSNTSIKMFVDGTQVGSTLTTPKMVSTPNYVFLGVFAHAKHLTHFNGYIDGIRIQVGESLYNSNFTPATSAPTANANTKLLMNFEDATKLNDSTSSLNPVLVGGGISVSSDRSKFGNTSLKMTGGTTDYVRAYNNSQPIAFIDDPFIIEGWFWLNSNNVGYQPLIMMASTGDLQGPVITLESNNTLTALLSYSGVNWDYAILTSIVPSANQWHHVALARNTIGGPIRLYFNGVLIGSSVTSNPIFTSETLWVGHYPYYPGGARTLNGYVDDARIVVGNFPYDLTGQFTPPTQPYTDGKNLLLHFDGANGSTSITDSSTTSKTVTAYGNAALSSAKSKFGGTSLRLDGTANTVIKPNNSSDYTFGTGDFSVETWVNFDNTNTWQVIFDTRILYGDGKTGLFLALTSEGKIIAWNNLETFLTSNTTMQPNIWYHVVISRRNYQINLYINGILDVSVTHPPSGASGTRDFGQGSLTIGGDYGSGTNLKGYIDEFRVCKGTAVYAQGDFAPPTAPFTLIG